MGCSGLDQHLGCGAYISFRIVQGQAVQQSSAAPLHIAQCLTAGSRADQQRPCRIAYVQRAKTRHPLRSHRKADEVAADLKGSCLVRKEEAHDLGMERIGNIDDAQPSGTLFTIVNAPDRHISIPAAYTDILGLAEGEQSDPAGPRKSRRPQIDDSEPHLVFRYRVSVFRTCEIGIPALDSHLRCRWNRNRMNTSWVRRIGDIDDHQLRWAHAVPSGVDDISRCTDYLYRSGIYQVQPPCKPQVTGDRSIYQL